MSKMMLLLVVLSCTACASIIGPVPDQTQAPSYIQTQQPSTVNVIDDEEQLRKTLIKLRQQDQLDQAQRLEAARKKAQQGSASQQVVAKQVHAAANAHIPVKAGSEQLWIRVPFKSGFTTVQKKMRKALTDVAGKYLAGPRTQRIVVRGFCDAEPIGGYASHRHQSRHAFKTQIILSQKRAKTVANILIKAGIPRDAIQTEGYGANYFIADNDTLAGRNKNRRVDVFLLGR